MGLALGPAKTCCNMKRYGAAVCLGGDYKSPTPPVCSIERGLNGGLSPFEWAQSGKPRIRGHIAKHGDVRGRPADPASPLRGQIAKQSKLRTSSPCYEANFKGKFPCGLTGGLACYEAALQTLKNPSWRFSSLTGCAGAKLQTSSAGRVCSASI